MNNINSNRFGDDLKSEYVYLKVYTKDCCIYLSYIVEAKRGVWYQSN